MLMDPQDAPDFRPLWDKTHTARKARQCDCCKDMIEVGQRYQSSGYLIDGKFEHWVRHENGEHYPSGCPKFAERDGAELEAQFQKDQELWNRGVR